VDLWTANDPTSGPIGPFDPLQAVADGVGCVAAPVTLARSWLELQRENWDRQEGWNINRRMTLAMLAR